MVVHDLTVQGYDSYLPKAQADRGIGLIKRRFTGADLKAVVLGSGVTPVNGDTYKIAKLGKYQMVDSVRTITIVVAGGATTLAIGYTNNTNASTTAFEASADINAIGIIWSADKRTMFEADGYYLTITPNTLASLADDAEIIIIAEVIDLVYTGIAAATALTQPVGG
jgi:hypothetical protein